MGLVTVSLIDKNGKVVFQGKLTSLPLKEECVINKSIELFNDSEPCIIHRTFVMKKIYLELEDYFNASIHRGQKELLIEQIPDRVKHVLDARESICKIILSS